MTINFVNFENIKTADDYVAALTALTISLATLVRVNISAYQNGLLDESENETASVINYETKRVANNIQKLVDLLAERHTIDVDCLINKLKTLSQKTDSVRRKKQVKK